MNQLGRVTTDLAENRAPDARLTVTVPAQWLRDGSAIEIKLPRLVNCEACAGGGCDACDRRGALITRGREAEPESTIVHLPSDSRPGVCVRLVEHGALPEGPAQVRGCLLVVFDAGSPSASVQRVNDAKTPSFSLKLSWAPWLALVVAVLLMYLLGTRL